MLAFLHAYTTSVDTAVTVNYFIGWTLVSILITFLFAQYLRRKTKDKPKRIWTPRKYGSRCNSQPR